MRIIISRAMVFAFPLFFCFPFRPREGYKLQELELTTEKMAAEGWAIARHNRFVIFVEGALPGEKVIATMTRRKRKHAFARVTQVVEPSPHRITPPCPMFGVCGGCSFQQMDYPAQVAMKRDVLLESLYGVPGAAENLADIIGADSPFYFRNKMGFAFGIHDGLPVLGLHRRGDWRSVVPAEACLLQSKTSNEIVQRALDLVRQNNISIYNDRDHTGCARHVVVREGKQTGERMVHLHAGEPHPAFDDLPRLLDNLATTVLVSIHHGAPENAPAESTRVLSGPGLIREQLNGFTFEIGPATFFQTNTLQAEKLFAKIMEWVGAAKVKNAVDLYAGTGPIAIHLGAVATNVLGIESNADSVRMAERNISLNNLSNVKMVCTEVEAATLAAFPAGTELVVVDPPRPGLHARAINTLLAVAAPTLIYVSCNPATLARDLKLLIHGGYRLEAVQPFDLFPHTFHIETVALLRR